MCKSIYLFIYFYILYKVTISEIYVPVMTETFYTDDA